VRKRCTGIGTTVVFTTVSIFRRFDLKTRDDVEMMRGRVHERQRTISCLCRSSTRQCRLHCCYCCCCCYSHCSTREAGNSPAAALATICGVERGAEVKRREQVARAPVLIEFALNVLVALARQLVTTRTEAFSHAVKARSTAPNNRTLRFKVEHFSFQARAVASRACELKLDKTA